MADHVFICYAREGQVFVLKLAANLKEQGIPVWLDQWDIPASTDWDPTSAMVKWNVFRSGGGGEWYTRSYYYASKQKRPVNLVGDGGTLWLVTSRRKRGEPR